ncbi:MAG: 5-(carboxyamino)imidazole ribonucleotide synthase [Carbonactinosporaceae bacterium]
MVGGGQLARMTCQAAIPLGVRLQVLVEGRQDSAAQVAGRVVTGSHRDLADLRRFAEGCDAITFDHEHVPGEHIRALERSGVTVRPGSSALAHAQDKELMRTRLAEIGVPSPRWRAVTGVADVERLAEESGWPVVLKTTRGGYDGRGVWTVEGPDDATRLVAASSAQGARLIAEERVEFERELAVLVARSPHGQAAVYPVVETVQVDGVCREVYAPAPGLPADRVAAAQQAALRVAGGLGVTGVLAVEMFETKDRIVVNELAMRPHNSGHWTLDGARTSQFEQHLRAVLDLPLGAPTPLVPRTVMVNVLGGDQPDLHARYVHCMARDPELRIHVYGKAVRPGRKVGHVTVTGDDLDDLRARARYAAAYLRGGSS